MGNSRERGTSAPDSHPGERLIKKSSKGKTRIIDDSTNEECLDESLKDVGGVSSKSESRIIANTTDGESLNEDLEDVGGESSKSGTRIIENTADRENVDEDLQDFGSGIFDQDVYDEDIEDVEDGDTVETAEGAARLREWLRYSDGGQPISSCELRQSP